MKTSLLLFCALLLPGFSSANPPPQISRAPYLSWLRSIDSTISAFTDFAFDWHEEQLRNPIPSEVNKAPEKIFVAVDRPIQQTISLEESGEIEEGNTVGFEAYAIVNAPIATVLEAKLFTWGKPVGKRSGETWPFDSVFSEKHDVIKEKWGPGNYFSSTTQTGGGIVKSLYDDYTLLVRGNSAEGYTLLASFFNERDSSATTAHISFVMLKPLPNGKTEFRQTVRQNGQSYKAFGIEYGRRNFGFNVARVRQGQKQFFGMVNELKTSGKIKENRP